MKLYHPYLDVTIDRTPRQAEVLEPAGWLPVGQEYPDVEAPDPPDLPPPDPPDDES